MKTSDIIEAVNKVGGSFKLTTLLQKRVVELMRGAPPLVKVVDKRDLLQLALTEIIEDKICLGPDEDADEEEEE